MNTDALKYNNPACVRSCRRFKGQLSYKTNKGLCVFESKVFGVRAMLLRLYYIVTRDEIHDLAPILKQWTAMNGEEWQEDMLRYAESCLYEPMTDTLPCFIERDFDRKPMWGHADLYHLSCVICYFESGYILPYREWKEAFDML